MAKKIEKFTFRGRGIPGKYPWDQWLDGNIWKLTRGEDFDPAPGAFRSAINGAAYRRRNMGVRTQIDGDEMVIQAYEKEPLPA